MAPSRGALMAVTAVAAATVTVMRLRQLRHRTPERLRDVPLGVVTVRVPQAVPDPELPALEDTPHHPRRTGAHPRPWPGLAAREEQRRGDRQGRQGARRRGAAARR